MSKYLRILKIKLPNVTEDGYPDVTVSIDGKSSVTKEQNKSFLLMRSHGGLPGWVNKNALMCCLEYFYLKLEHLILYFFLQDGLWGHIAMLTFLYNTDWIIIISHKLGSSTPGKRLGGSSIVLYHKKMCTQNTLLRIWKQRIAVAFSSPEVFPFY